MNSHVWENVKHKADADVQLLEALKNTLVCTRHTSCRWLYWCDNFTWIFIQTPLCSWSRKHNCKPLCKPQACSSEHSHAPTTQLPGALRHTPMAPQSHPGVRIDDFFQWFIPFVMVHKHLLFLILPGRSPFRPPDIRHTSCFQWFGKDRHWSRCHHSGGGPPGTATFLGILLQRPPQKKINVFKHAWADLKMVFKYFHRDRLHKTV